MTPINPFTKIFAFKGDVSKEPCPCTCMELVTVKPNICVPLLPKMVNQTEEKETTMTLFQVYTDL